MRKIKSSIILSYISLIVSNLSNIFLTSFMITKLGNNNYGIINLSNSIVNYFLIFDVCIGTTAIKYFTKERLKKKSSNLDSLTTLFLLINVIISIFIVVFGIFINKNISLFINSNYSTNEIFLLRIILVILFLGTAFNISLSTFYYLIFSNEYFIIFKLINLIKIGILPILIIFALFFTNNMILIVFINVLLTVSLRIFSAFFCVKNKLYKFSFKLVNIKVIKEILYHVTFILIGMLAEKILWNSDQIIISKFLGSYYITIYSLAVNLSRMYLNINGIPGEFNTHYLTEIINTNNLNKLSKTFINIVKYQFIFSTYIYFAFILVGKNFIHIWVGSEFTSSYYISVILITGMYINFTDNTGSKILKLKGEHRFYSILKFIIVLLNIPITMIFIKKIGIIGGSISTLLIFVIPMTIIMNLYYSKMKYINFIELIKKTYRTLLIGIISCVLSRFLQNQIDTNNFFSLIISSCIYTLIYALGIYIVCINKNDRKKLLYFLKVRNKGSLNHD